MAINREQLGVVAIHGVCDQCDFRCEDIDPAKTRSEAKAHMRESGHTVQVEVTSGEVYHPDST